MCQRGQAFTWSNQQLNCSKPSINSRNVWMHAFNMDWLNTTWPIRRMPFDKIMINFLMVSSDETVTGSWLLVNDPFIWIRIDDDRLIPHNKVFLNRDYIVIRVSLKPVSLVLDGGLIGFLLLWVSARQLFYSQQRQTDRFNSWQVFTIVPF